MKSQIEIASLLHRSFGVRSSTFDDLARTVELTWSSGAAVRRSDRYSGQYWETLSLDPAHVDLTRLNSGGPLLNSHQQWEVANRLGVVVRGSARIEKGLAVATVQISRNPEGERLMVDLRDGMPLGISCGYRVEEYLRTEPEDEDDLPTYHAVRWTPLELSVVNVPADAAAQSRSAVALDFHPVPITTTARRAQSAAGELESQMTTIELDPVAAELERAANIQTLGATYRASPALIKRAISNPTVTDAKFRELILEEMRTNQEKNPVFSIAPSDYDARSELPLAEALADAISARIDRGHKPTNGSRQFVGLSVPEMARRALEARGTGTAGMSPNELVKRGLHTTSDFPAALQLAGERQLRKGYEATPSGLKAIAKGTTSRDFRPKATIILAGGGQLLKVNESGEFKRSSFVEGVESYALSTFGKIFGLTRQSLTNDDLGVFADLPARFGRMASEFEATYLAELLERNPKMGDGKAAFHLDHANLAATGSALSLTSLSAGRLAMRQQIDANGDLIALAPKFLIVPSTLETLGEQLLSSVSPANVGDANPFASTLQLIVEPRLKSQTAWYLSSDPDQFASLEYAHLEGENGPRLDQRVGFDIDGTEWKIGLDFGAAIVDHRGLYKNPGA